MLHFTHTNRHRPKLKVVGSRDYYTFFYAKGNDEFKELGKCDTYFLSSEVAGGFTGVYIGLFATGNGSKNKATANFDWFGYKPLQRSLEIYKTEIPG